MESLICKMQLMYMTTDKERRKKKHIRVGDQSDRTSGLADRAPTSVPPSRMRERNKQNMGRRIPLRKAALFERW